MLRLFVMSVALVGLVAMADQAEARGRRGCGGGSCYSGGYSSGGCNTGSCGVSTSGCYGGSCQAAATPATSAPVAKKEAAPAAPKTTVVQNGTSSTARYARWRSGGRRFR